MLFSYQNQDGEICGSEIQEMNGNRDVEVDVPKRNPTVQRSKTMSMEMFNISDKASALFPSYEAMYRYLSLCAFFCSLG